MQNSNSTESNFINQLKEIIEENISDEKFGVSELADKIGMSRSNLLRKVKKDTNLSVSLFIRKIRLEFAKNLLQQEDLTVSEISYQVGFSSPSYFIKCFREKYGFPPGELAEKEQEVMAEPEVKSKHPKHTLLIVLIGLVLIIGGSIIFWSRQKPKEPIKSIAVLPFKNDSNDSSNIYIVNGLMESLLNKLQQIENIRVISRTSVEKYRHTSKSIPEIAEELNVKYFVEGSGQKIGDQILLNVQLIEASSDDHLWAQQYQRQTKDIFQLQMDVANTITKEIKAFITPEEKERLKETPTQNLVAYDFFLKGVDLLYKGNGESLLEAIEMFKKAIEHDAKFGRAYADIAIAYYYLDILQAEKKYKNELIDNADKALLYSPKAPQSLVAKGLSYIIKGERNQAVPYFEKALEYNPNSSFVLNYLSDFYANHVPDTEKYLTYALKGLGVNAANDSVSQSYTYLHVSNALIQTGFTNEALHYINKSLEANQENIFSNYVKAYILYAKNRDLKQTSDLLLETLAMDTTRIDVIQEVAKIYYYRRDYESALKYYQKFLHIVKEKNMDVFKGEYIKIALTFYKMGLNDEASKLFEQYKSYIDQSKSIYKHLGLSAYYSAKGEVQKSLTHLEIFSQYDNYHYWIVLFMRIDPLVENFQDVPLFNEIMKKIEKKFWKRHKRIKTTLEEKNLIEHG